MNLVYSQLLVAMSDDDCRRNGVIQDGYDSDGFSVYGDEVFEMWDEQDRSYRVKMEDVASFDGDYAFGCEKFRPVAPLVIPGVDVERVKEGESGKVEGSKSGKVGSLKAQATTGTKTKGTTKPKTKGKKKAVGGVKISAESKAMVKKYGSTSSVGSDPR